MRISYYLPYRYIKLIAYWLMFTMMVNLLEQAGKTDILEHLKNVETKNIFHNKIYKKVITLKVTMNLTGPGNI